MKAKAIIFLAWVLIFGTACEKENPPEKESPLDIEYHFSLKSGQIAYSDDEGNQYYTGVFDKDTLNKNYSILVEKDVSYRLSLSDIDCDNVEFYFLEADLDTLYHGEQADQGNTIQYIHIQSVVTDTFYISLRYTGDINFHKKSFHLSIEDLTIQNFQWGGHTWEGTRDWLVKEDGNLQLALHNTSSYRWLRLKEPNLLNYEVEVNMGFASGLPEGLAGMAVNATERVRQRANTPEQCFNFMIKGPYSWQIWYAHQDGGTGYEYGYTSERLNTGIQSTNKLNITNIKDSISYTINDEPVHSLVNRIFMSSYVYLIVEDNRLDTINFSGFNLTKK